MRQTSAKEIKEALREMHRQIRIARQHLTSWADIEATSRLLAINRVLAINVNRGEYIANECIQAGFHVFTSYEG